MYQQRNISRGLTTINLLNPTVLTALTSLNLKLFVPCIFLYRASFQRMEWKPTDVTILFVYCWVSTCFGPTGSLCCHTEHASRADRHWTNGCVNSCTKSPEDGPVGPKHVETQQYTNKSDISWFSFHKMGHTILPKELYIWIRVTNCNDRGREGITTIWR